MTIRLTLGFAAAEGKKPGDLVAFGGQARRVLAVRREGKDWPAFRLFGVDPAHDLADEGGFISWQYCGDVSPEAAAASGVLEEARKLLHDWLHYSRTMQAAGLTAAPAGLVNQTVGLLDSTAV